MAKVFKYRKPDARSRWMTVMWIILAAGAAIGVWMLWGEGGYATAWTISIIAAIYLLCILSIPRNIKVTQTGVDICCVVEITHIPLSYITSVRQLERGEGRKIIPLLGAYGFFGYYGYYLDLRNWESVKVYCTRRENIVEITNIYEKRYYVNCSDPALLIQTIEDVRNGADV